MAATPNPALDVSGLVLRIKELEEQHLAFRNSLVCAFNQMLDLKDINTGVHSTRLAEWALRVARKMDMPEERLYQVEVAALLHDIGKIGVPDAILKKAGPLTPEERALINRHPEYSWSILRLFPGLEEASLYALHHHESVDGTGYPAGLKGNDIPTGFANHLRHRRLRCDGLESLLPARPSTLGSDCALAAQQWNPV